MNPSTEQLFQDSEEVNRRAREERAREDQVYQESLSAAAAEAKRILRPFLQPTGTGPVIDHKFEPYSCPEKANHCVRCRYAEASHPVRVIR